MKVADFGAACLMEVPDDCAIAASSGSDYLHPVRTPLAAHMRGKRACSERRHTVLSGDECDHLELPSDAQRA